MPYEPPFTLIPAIVSLVAEIAEAVGRLSLAAEEHLRLRRINRIRTIRGSLAIEGNTMSEEQITAVLEGKPVIAPPREIQEVRNALAAYERLGRLWQTLILSRWKPVLADLPVESLVHAHQAAYYRAIEQSTEQGDSSLFIRFMLERILDACRANTPQVTPDVTPQVMRLLTALCGEMNREELMQALALKDSKHFRRKYLTPALDAGLVEMTQPDSPRSPTQKYRLTDRGLAMKKRRELRVNEKNF